MRSERRNHVSILTKVSEWVDKYRSWASDQPVEYRKRVELPKATVVAARRTQPVRSAGKPHPEFTKRTAAGRAARRWSREHRSLRSVSR